MVEIEHETPVPAPVNAAPDNDLIQVAFQFGKDLQYLPSMSATASQACKFLYGHFPSSRETLARHGRLRGLVIACPYLQLVGAASGGRYVLSLNQTQFDIVSHA